MHALLALGGSHLTRVSDQETHNTSAIVHRGKAITGLNEALARGSNDPADADAMLAACYALTFQASYMGDGMSDFIAMVRGCALLHEQINRTHGPNRSAFRIGPDFHMNIMETRMNDLPQIDAAYIDPGIAAVEALRPLLHGNVGSVFHASLLQVLYALRASPKAGYMNFVSVYGTFFDMSHAEFATFIDPANTVPQLLMAHFISLQMLVTPLTLLEINRPRDTSGARALLGTAEWAEGIMERTPLAMRGYLSWVRTIVSDMKHDVEILLDGRYKTVPLKIISGRQKPSWEQAAEAVEEDIVRTTGSFVDLMDDSGGLGLADLPGIGGSNTFAGDSAFAGESTQFAEGSTQFAEGSTQFTATDSTGFAADDSTVFEGDVSLFEHGDI